VSPSAMAAMHFQTLAAAVGVHVGEPWQTKSIVSLVTQYRRTALQYLYGQTKLLIFDEVGKADDHQLDVMNEATQWFRHSTQVMGGLQFVVVGDSFQLAPSYRVNAGDGKDFFFESRLFEQAKAAVPPLQFAVLLRVRRQRDPRFIEALRDLKYGQRTDNTDAMFVAAMGVEFNWERVDPFKVQHIWYSNHLIEVEGRTQHIELAQYANCEYWQFDAVDGKFHYAKKAAFKWKFGFSLVFVEGARYRYAAHNEVEIVPTVSGKEYEVKQAERLECVGWNKVSQVVYLKVLHEETQPILKLTLKKWTATWRYGMPVKEVPLTVYAFPLTYEMAKTPDASQGDGYEFLHLHTKGMKPKDKNMIYMCASRAVQGPWENGFKMDEQPLDDVYALVNPHYKSILFSHEELGVEVPAAVLAAARAERAAALDEAPPAIAAALAQQASAVRRRR
jgi:hypothetical protein